MAEGRSEEHALEYQELFNEYLLIFEGKLEEFIGVYQTKADTKGACLKPESAPTTAGDGRDFRKTCSVFNPGPETTVRFSTTGAYFSTRDPF